MSTHRLTARQLIKAPLADAFTFFAEPHNLARITPVGMRFEFLSDDFEMREGLEIDYRLRPLLGVPVTWKTRITQFDPPHSFTDVQESGPYRRWEHRHSLRSVEGGTLIEDEVLYEMPLGPLGGLGHRMLVRGELEQVFRHRARIIESVFTPRGEIDRPLTVAVAGGTGFVGGGIALELHRRGHRVVVLSSRGEEARGGLPDGLEIRRADVTHPDSDLAGALSGTDALVISLAFKNLPVEAPRRGRTFDEVDAGGTQRLVAAARSAGVHKLIYVSGAGAAPDAARHWFRAKWRAEESVRASGLRWTIVRPTWVYGPRDVSLNRFLGFARRLPVVPLTNLGNQRLAPVFIDDLASLAVDALVDEAADEQVFELGGPQELSMREVIDQALRAAGLRRPIVPGPAPLIKLGLAPLTLLPEPPLTPAAVDFINQPATVDVKALLERMPRRLTPLAAGLATYVGPSAGPGELTFDSQPKESGRHSRQPSSAQ